MPDHTFGRQRRLLTARDYSEVFATRGQVRGSQFVLHYRTKAEGEARLGLAIAKRYARRAVLRNTLKRLAREQFRGRAASLAPLDMILRLAKPIGIVAIEKNKASWRREIATLLDLLPVACGSGVA